MSDPPGHEDLLESYLRKALERLDRGETLHPTELCREHPEMAPAVAEALGLADELSVLQTAAFDQDPLAGKVLGSRYRLESCLGRGAMGVVYQAADQELQRKVAVKILDARLFHDPTSEQRFLREAEMLAAMQHPNVVGIHDRGRTDEGILYLVMEQLHGCSMSALLGRLGKDEDPIESVRELLHGQPPSTGWLRLCAQWTADLAAGLAAVHGRGITHRDLKPSNVFIRRDLSPVLLDFGIAAREEDARLTATASTLGTPSYMAPEQTGSGPAGPQVDVYGLGATLYHLLARRPPYAGDPAAVLVALQTSDPAALRSVRPDVPRDLQAIVEKAMERDPRRRYPDAAAMEADLRAFLEHRPVSVRPLSWAGRKWRAVRRRPARAVAVGGVALALVSAAVVIPIALDQAERERQREKQELRVSLPALLAVEGQPSQRLAEFVTGETKEDLATLDRILELDPQDPVRLFRAALRQDLGDHAGAAADYEFLVKSSGSEYLRALARRYSEADPQKRGTEAVSIDGLPEPVTAYDRYVAGFHELRNRHRDGYAKRALDHLTAAKDYPPARDLRLIALVGLADLTTEPEERARLFQEAHDESLELERIYGKPTARTLAIRGVALVEFKQYEQAVKVLSGSLDLRPDRHGPHQNLGIAYWRRGMLDEAEHHLREAQRLRPHFWNTYIMLAQVHQDRSDFAAAYAAAEQVPEDELPASKAWWKADLTGLIAVAEAAALRETEPDAAKAAARKAIEAFEQAMTGTSHENTRRRLEVHRQMAFSLLTEDLATTTKAFLNQLLSSPRPQDPYEVANLANVLPHGELDAEGVWYLGLYFRKLAHALAGEDSRLKERLQREFGKLAESGPPK